MVVVLVAVVFAKVVAIRDVVVAIIRSKKCRFDSSAEIPFVTIERLGLSNHSASGGAKINFY